MGLGRQMEGFRAQDKGATALLSPQIWNQAGKGRRDLLLHELRFLQRGRQGRREAVGGCMAVRTL